MIKALPALFVLLASMTVDIPHSLAQDTSAPKKIYKETSSKKAAPSKKEADAVDEEDKEPDISSSTSIDYHCELGNRLSLYKNNDDNNHIALRWNKQLLRLTRVSTTTGANRFENRKNGWVWIDIPAKAMLLDSKKGRQLANECRPLDGTTIKTLETRK